MAAAVVMQSHRVTLSELMPTRYNKFTKAELANNLENADFAKVPTPSNNFNVPSTKFNFSSTIKRSFDLYEDEDQENVDPATLLGSGKRARGLDGEAVKADHGTKFNLNTVKDSAIPESTKIARITLGVKPRAPASTRPTGIASRHRLGGKRGGRPNQFGFGANAPAIGKAAVDEVAPVSVPVNGMPKPTTKGIDVPVKNRVSALRKGRMSNKAQNFVIFEDTPFDEMANLMQHSAYTLDISDDEKSSKFKDDSDKENVPPPGAPAAALRPVGRADMMTEEVRSPLGQLEASLYYADGCDANSVIIAPQEPLPIADTLDVEFGSIDGELLGDCTSKSNKVEDSVAGKVIDIACDKPNVA
ncbi:MAG: hypothetical protein LQ352_005436 [Teloschistes flavicans]|nr:MAG: hypothetical protein LQ352_005436 [Teloschistes flavicans]